MKIRVGHQKMLIDVLTRAFDKRTHSLRFYPIMGYLGRRGASIIVWLCSGTRRHLGRRLLGWPLSGRGITTVLGALIAVRDFDRAEVVLTVLDPDPAREDDSAWRLRQLQVWCTSGQTDRALKLVEAWGGFNQVPEEATATAAGLLASLGRWDDVINLLDDRVRRGHGLQGHLLFEAVAGAARQTVRYEEVIDLLDLAPSSRALKATRDALMAETVLLNLLGIGTGLPRYQVKDTFHADRLRAIEKVVAGRGQRAKAGTPGPHSMTPVVGSLVWCSDRQYLLGTAVSVWSLLRHNPGLTPTGGIRVVVAPDVVDVGRDVFTQLSEVAGKKIAVIDADSLLPAARDLRTAYGLFTPGYVLSEAAYYRLFAVAALLPPVDAGRIIYFDSDTCIGPGMAQLFSMDMHGHPIAARRERPMGLRYESRRTIMDEATRRLGLPPGSYFNSGVLVFDHAQADVAARLDRAIQLVMTEPERLMFHDQCALNVAFEGRVEALPENFNSFIRPQNAPSRGSPTILHYMERPKPWDPLYPTVNCGRWFEELSALGTVLPADRISHLFSLQFPLGASSRTASSPGARSD